MWREDRTRSVWNGTIIQSFRVELDLINTCNFERISMIPSMRTEYPTSLVIALSMLCRLSVLEEPARCMLTCAQ